MKPPGVMRRQQGMTLWSLLYVLITLGLIGIVSAKSVPVYLNAHEVRAALDEVAAAPAMADASAGQIQAAVQKHFDAGYVSNVRGRDVTVTRTGDKRQLEILYQERRPLFYNLSLVYSFDAKALIQGHHE